MDSNVILDILTRDLEWYNWSSAKLAEFAESHDLVINDIVYTEISIGFKEVEDLEEVLSGSFFKTQPIPKEALFLAGKIFLRYKSKHWLKNSTLPDFLLVHTLLCSIYPC